MLTLELKRDLLFKARDRSVLSAEERAAVEQRLGDVKPGTHTLDVSLADFPVGYWRAILDDSRLTANQRAVIARHVFGMESRPAGLEQIYQSEVDEPVTFGSTFATLPSNTPNCELFLNGRWYPVIGTCQFIEDESKIVRDVALIITLSICELTVQRYFRVYRDLFLDAQGRPVTRTVLDVLRTFGLRGLQASSADYNLRLVKAERQAREIGKVVVVGAPVMVNVNRLWEEG